MPAGERDQFSPVVSGDEEQGFSGAAADLTLALGRLTERMAGGVKPRVPWEACRPVGPIGAVTIVSGAGTYDQPDLMGPKDPYWWDLRRFAAWGFTAGSVALYKNAPGTLSGTQIGSLAAAGNITWSVQELLAPRDRLIVVATSITGNVQFEIRAVEIETSWLPEYLL